jgi:hypothetical protein
MHSPLISHKSDSSLNSRANFWKQLFATISLLSLAFVAVVCLTSLDLGHSSEETVGVRRVKTAAPSVPGLHEPCPYSECAGCGHPDPVTSIIRACKSCCLSMGIMTGMVRPPPPQAAPYSSTAMSNMNNPGGSVVAPPAPALQVPEPNEAAYTPEARSPSSEGHGAFRVKVIFEEAGSFLKEDILEVNEHTTFADLFAARPPKIEFNEALAKIEVMNLRGSALQLKYSDVKMNSILQVEPAVSTIVFYIPNFYS